MSKIVQLKFISMFLFIAGFVILLEKIDPWIIIGGVMAIQGQSMINDIIALERSLKSLDEHQKIAEDVLSQLEKFKKEHENAG